MKQSELLDQFIVEARECLEGIGERLLLVEKNPNDSDVLNDLFRLVHTLKGNCGLFSFKPLESVVHACEDLLDQVRSQSLTYSLPMADALLDAMDFTAEMIDEISATAEIDPSSIDKSSQLSALLREFLQGTTPHIDSVAKETSKKNELPRMPSWHERVLDDWLTLHPQGIAIRYEPEAEAFFKGEDPWNLVLHTPGLVELSVKPRQAWNPIETLDCYACNLDVVIVSTSPAAYLQEHFRYVPEQISLLPLVDIKQARAVKPSETSNLPGQQPSRSTLENQINKRIQQLWIEQQAVLSRPDVNSGIQISVRRTLSNLLHASDWTSADEWRTKLSQIPSDSSTADLLAWTNSISALLASNTPSNSGETNRKVEEPHASTHKVLKVGQEKIDRLMELIGEMVVAKNSLPYLAQRAEQVFEQRELAREIKAQYAIINRIAEEMQNAIMQVRMLPVGTVFQRFGRLVRDISNRLGKEVELEVHGEETEADKNVIESLADPLIHILRNSLDHGIEMPDVRASSGKPTKGIIRVNARQESDRVLIEIIDDGAGVNPDRVRQVAVQRGLIPADKAMTLSDTEAVQLIFLPGFSTTEKISDLSGRGVGMDVVRTAVERINGSVTLSSTVGQGTTITLSLPLSMAVTNVMVVEIAGRRFGVPMDMIIETVRVHTEDIHHFKQCSTTVLRGKVVPLRSLHDLLSMEAETHVNEDGEVALLLVRSIGEPVGLLVDQFHGATDIILKPLEGVLAGLTGFAGTALMGDGSVLMILHPKELLTCQSDF